MCWLVFPCQVVHHPTDHSSSSCLHVSNYCIADCSSFSQYLKGLCCLCSLLLQEYHLGDSSLPSLLKWACIHSLTLCSIKTAAGVASIDPLQYAADVASTYTLRTHFPCQPHTCYHGPGRWQRTCVVWHTDAPYPHQRASSMAPSKGTSGTADWTRKSSHTTV